MAGLSPRNKIRSVLGSRMEANEYAFDISILLRDVDGKIEMVFGVRELVLSIVPKPPYDYVPLTYGAGIYNWSRKRREGGCGGVV